MERGQASRVFFLADGQERKGARPGLPTPGVGTAGQSRAIAFLYTRRDKKAETRHTLKSIFKAPDFPPSVLSAGKCSSVSGKLQFP